MQLREIMRHDVEVSHPGEMGIDALKRMRAHKIHHLVVMQRGKTLGVLSSRDLSAEGDLSREVGELMAARPVTAAPNTSLADAAKLMQGYALGCLPIVEKGKLTGIVTLSDVLRLAAKGAFRRGLAKESERPWHRAGRPVAKHRAAEKQYR
jgi:CBS domain-containing protein